MLAECVDAWRLVPRALLFAYWVLVYDVTDRLLTWYMSLPAIERTAEASGMAFGIFTALLGLGTNFMNAYIKTGRNWQALKEDES
jgi:hypothetical protein